MQRILPLPCRVGAACRGLTLLVNRPGFAGGCLV
jgi:hypothetical protein